MNAVSAGTTRAGLLYGLAAYGWWGLVPLYFKAIDRIPPLEILAQRIVWSMLFLAVLLRAVGRWNEVKRCFHRPMIWTFLATTLLIAANWYVFILSVERKQVVQTSLGYFITPLMNVGLGMFFFRERLRRLQWLALTLAVAGVLIFALAHHELPWLALSLAGSFGLYGLLRKTLPVDGLIGLSVESLLLLPVAGGYLLWQLEHQALGQYGWQFDVLLLFSGVVTAVPLMCFAQAVRRLPLTTVGFLQYLSPSLSFLLAVLVFQEPFEDIKWVSFAFIWTALAIFSVDAVRTYRRTR